MIIPQIQYFVRCQENCESIKETYLACIFNSISIPGLNTYLSLGKNSWASKNLGSWARDVYVLYSWISVAALHCLLGWKFCPQTNLLKNNSKINSEYWLVSRFKSIANWRWIFDKLKCNGFLHTFFIKVMNQQRTFGTQKKPSELNSHPTTSNFQLLRHIVIV